MTELRKYKHLLAVLLLALYAFIATPVQLWHHHNYAAKIISLIQDDGVAKISATDANDKTAEENCLVCSHNYSVYNNDLPSEATIFLPAYILCKQFYVSTIPLSPTFTNSNKGPPVMA